MDGGLEYRGSARGAVSVKYRTLVCILIIIYLKRTGHVFFQEGASAIVVLLETSEGQCQVHLGQLW